MSLSNGTRLGAFEITGLIGAGGMGEVYRAADTRLQRRVAIKILPAAVAGDSDRRARFEREAQAVSALNHPNICTLHDIGEQDGTHFLVMEFVEGQTLEDYLCKGPIPLNLALQYSIQILDALETAHRKGVVHRDLKPANIMITKSGVKLLDFGLVKFSQGNSAESTTTGMPTRVSDTLTVAGAILGTPQYMAPEQLTGGEADARTDLFSFGAILYEMLTGRKAFVGKTQASLIGAILHEHPPPLASIAATMPRALDRLVRTCLEKDRNERWQTARDLKRRLIEVEEDLSELATPAVPSEISRRSPRSVASVVAAAALVVALGGWFLLNSPPPDDVIDSVVVLPFVNETGDSDADDLKTVADIVANNLAKLRTLRVVPPGPSAQVNDQSLDPYQEADRLNVRAFMTGQIREVGDRFVFQVQLVDAIAGRQLWGELFDEEGDDPLRVSQEVSRRVVEELRVELGGEGEQHVVAGGTEIEEAFDAYLNGIRNWNLRTEEGLTRATRYFETALDIDQDYAEAYAGLAYAYLMLAFYTYLPAAEARDPAFEAAEKALQIEPDLADAHTALGWIAVRYDWNWSKGRYHFQRALELRPNSGTAQNWSATIPTTIGEWTDAIQRVESGEELAPNSRGFLVGAGYTYMYAERYEEAERVLRAALDLDPNFGVAYRYLAGVYRLQGEDDLAIEASQQAVRTGTDRAAVIDLVSSLAAAGRINDALERLDQAEQLARDARDFYVYVAIAHAWLNDDDDAFTWLAEAVDIGDPWLPFLRVHPELDSLRDDERMDSLIRRVGIPESYGNIPEWVD